jgi:hypothetical protein
MSMYIFSLNNHKVNEMDGLTYVDYSCLTIYFAIGSRQMTDELPVPIFKKEQSMVI